MIRILAPVESRAFFGAERANIDLLWRLQQRGASVSCLVRAEDWPENLRVRRVLEDRKISWQRSVFPEYPSSRYWKYWPKVLSQLPFRYLSLNKLATAIIQRDSITHLHLFNPIQAANLYATIERTRVSVIYRCGDSPATHNTFYRAIWTWLQRRVDHVVTESNFIRNKVLSLGFPAERVHLIRTPPPVRVIKSPFQPLDIGLNEVNKRRNMVFGYVGQISEAKGVPLLLASFRKVLEEISDVRLLLAGPITDPYSKGLVNEVSRWASPQQVEFLGEIEDVPGFLSACDVHVAPSIRPESYGIVAIEAKSEGVPSVVFSEGGLGELVTHGVDGIVVEQKRPESLATAMLEYIKNPGLVSQHGRSAQASIQGHLQVHRHDDLWWQLYTSNSGSG